MGPAQAGEECKVSKRITTITATILEYALWGGGRSHDIAPGMRVNENALVAKKKKRQQL